MSLRAQSVSLFQGSLSLFLTSSKTGTAHTPSSIWHIAFAIEMGRLVRSKALWDLC